VSRTNATPFSRLHSGPAQRPRLLTRKPRYFFDLDPIREPTTSAGRSHRTRRGGYPPREAVPTLGGGSSPRIDLNQGLAGMKAAGRESYPLGKNPGDVWTIPTASYHGAHFATFPVELVRRPLLATCPERVCTECGAAGQRAPQVMDGRPLAVGPLRSACGHSGWRPGRVLDPFMGSGSTAVAAEQHSRNWIGIELNPEYAELAEKRLAEWREKTGVRPQEPHENTQNK